MRILLFVAVALAVASCTQSGDAPTTTAPPAETTTTTAPTAPTTSSSTTTSSLATTTTIDPGEIDYPENPDTVDDLPEALTVHIGAPMPDPDLRISGPDDP